MQFGVLAAHPFRLNDSAAECGLSTGASGGIESRDVFFGGPLLNARPPVVGRQSVGVISHGSVMRGRQVALSNFISGL